MFLYKLCRLRAPTMQIYFKPSQTFVSAPTRNELSINSVPIPKVVIPIIATTWYQCWNDITLR